MKIPRPILAEVRRHLAAAYPEEGCGLLLGRRSDELAEVLSQIPIANRRTGDGGAATRYLVSPEDFLSAERAAREGGLEVIGVYHSHPDVPARPSAFDLDHAWPWYRYLIVSVRRGRPREERVWELAEDRSGFHEIQLQMEED